MSEQTLERNPVAVFSDVSSATRKQLAHSASPFLQPSETLTVPSRLNNDAMVSTSSPVETQQCEVSPTYRRVLFDLFAGAMAGSLAKTTIAPFDRTKIYFQSTQQRFSLRVMVTFLVERYRTEGILNLWRGNTATLARIIPYAAVQFAAHGQWKRVLEIDKPNTVTPSWMRFLAGSLAGVTSQLFTYPLDLARAQMAVTRRDVYSSLFQVFQKICKQEGFRGLYRGVTPTVLGVIPYAGTSFGIYETLKHRHKSKTGDEVPNALERMMFGALAGLCGQTTSYPLDIVRRRMQTAKLTGNEAVYTTVWGTLMKVYRNEGLAHGLYKGLSLNWIKGPLAVGISFSTFDSMKQFLEYVFEAR